MDRKHLVFFTSADPRENPGPAWSAYHFAEVAARTGLDAEVRLAGDAVRVAQPDGIENSDRGKELRAKVEAGAGGPFLISL
jgi:predicted peroxiredoxin